MGVLEIEIEANIGNEARNIGSERGIRSMDVVIKREWGVVFPGIETGEVGRGLVNMVRDEEGVIVVETWDSTILI